jgi:N-acetylneuraminic acid mutarotase
VLNGFDTVQVYDPVTNAWRTSDDPASGLAPMPLPRAGTGKAVFANGEFFVFGGETQDGPGATDDDVFDRVDVYNPLANAWRQTDPMPAARHGIFPLTSANRIYVAAGGTTAGFARSSILEILELT